MEKTPLVLKRHTRETPSTIRFWPREKFGLSTSKVVCHPVFRPLSCVWECVDLHAPLLLIWWCRIVPEHFFFFYRSHCLSYSVHVFLRVLNFRSCRKATTSFWSFACVVCEACGRRVRKFTGFAVFGYDSFFLFLISSQPLTRREREPFPHYSHWKFSQKWKRKRTKERHRAWMVGQGQVSARFFLPSAEWRGC